MLRQWAESRTGGGDPARSGLQRLDPCGQGVRVPFPFVSRTWVRGELSNREINDLIKQAPIIMVPIAGLASIQKSVRSERVTECIDASSRGESITGKPSPVPTDLPIVIERDGKRVLWDGNHRATAAKLRGETSIKARFVKVAAA